MPREKLKHYGPEKLSDIELLALILRTGKKGENVLKFSNKVYKLIKELGVNNLDLTKLSKLSGLGIAKSSQIIASLELSKRLLLNKQSTILLSPKDVHKAMSDYLNSKKEHFVVFYLDSRNQSLVKEVVSIGTLNSSLVHPREVFENAIKNNASSIIISHNHPSNVSKPSAADIEVTNMIKEAGKILGIEMLDHVIVTKSDFYSFKENFPGF